MDASESLPDRAQRHVRDCPACRQFYQLERELTRRLAADAERHSQSPSPFLHAKIMASLERSAPSAEPHPKFRHPIWATALVIAGLGLFSLPILRNSHQSNPPLQQAASSNSNTTTQQITSQVPKAGARNLFAWSKALDQPLETEMQSVVSDAKTAMHLLAQNFLPERQPIASPR